MTGHPLDSDGHIAFSECGAEMVDGASFYGAKAYKDAKALNMMTVLEVRGRAGTARAGGSLDGVVYTDIAGRVVSDSGLRLDS